MSKRELLLECESIINNENYSELFKTHLQLLEHIEELYELIYNHNSYTNIDFIFDAEVYFIAGYCRGLFHVTNNFAWSELENNIEDLAFNFFRYLYYLED